MNEVLRLHGKGFHLVPWLNRNAIERKPLVSGFTEATYSVETVERFLSQWPEADWAIVPRGFVVLDVDVKTTDGKAELEALCLANGTTIEQLTESCPTTKTFSNGRHFYFSTKETQISSCHIGEALELKHLNSVHVPPSQGYFWIKELDSITSLPPLPDWLGRLWVAKSQSKYGDQQFLQPRFAKGSRHSAMVSFAGKARDALALSGVELTEVLKVVRRTRCDNPDTIEDKELSKIAEDMAKFSPTDVQGLALAGDEGAQSVIDMFNRTGVPLEAEVGSVAYNRTKILPDELLYPTPMIKMWVEWINSNNHRKQPEVALAGVLTAIGSMVGRNLSWQNQSANIYTLGLAGSGEGKHACRDGIERVMKEVGYGDRLGSGDFGSDSGFREDLVQTKELLMVADEFHGFLEKASSTQPLPYIAGVIRILLEAHTGTISGKTLKGNKMEAIEGAHFSLFALCQPSIFWATCKQKQINNGFMGRFIIFNGRPMPRAEPMTVVTDPPVDLIELIKTSANVNRTLLDRRMSDTSGREIISASEECIAHYVATFNKCEVITQHAMHKEHDVTKATLYARTMEKANRLALIHAWSLNPAAPVMTIESIEWSYQVMLKCNEFMLDGISENTATNGNETNVKAILKVIGQAGKDGIMNAVLLSNTQEIPTRQRNDIISDLMDSGKISKFIGIKTDPNKKGPPPVMYRINQLKEVIL